jgi:hypothetical protein
MPLHLLHHKSWHVYNTANVEKVERDKENARRKEEEEEMRMNQADQERRLQQLRGNAYGTDYKPSPSPSSPVSRPSNTIPGLKKAANKHVNFFEDLEKVPKVEGNKEREIEIAAEKKKWEDLVTSKLVNATKDHKPWYSQLDRVSGLEKEKSEVERELKEKKEIKWKEEADPLKRMEGFLKRKREIEEGEKRKLERMERELTERERRERGRTPERYSRDDRSGERKHRRRHRKRSRSRSRSPSSKDRKHRHRHRSPVSSRSEESVEIERLREERRKREAIENERVQQLINKKKVTESRYEAVGHGGYSAQFHPEAVRR